jgi:hypothetical protein
MNGLTALEYVEGHRITSELKRYGVTNAQLDALRFSGFNRDCPFDLWSFRWKDGTPSEAMPLFKAYCALKWLILENPPYSRNKEDAWRLINDWLVAGNAQLGQQTRVTQQERARKPRGKILNSDKTINGLIEELALSPEHGNEKADELWPHFYASLEELDLEPVEIPHISDLRKRAYEYDTPTGDCRKMTYGRFANVVAKARKKKSH